MVNSINPLYKDLTGRDSDATVANLDKWLSTLSERVTELKIQNKLKDDKIKTLENKIVSLEAAANTSIAANQSADFWNKLLKAVTNVISSIATKENSELAKKEKNIIIFGVPESVAATQAEKNNKDKESVKEILSAIGIDDNEEFKIIHLKKKQKTLNLAKFY